MIKRFLECLNLRFGRDKKARGVLALALIAVFCTIIVVGGLYVALDNYAEKSSVKVDVSGGGGTIIASNKYLPVAWNLTAYESGSSSKAAGTYYAMPKQYSNPYDAVTNGLYFDSCSFTTTSVELVAYTQLEGSNLWDGQGFWIYGPHDSSTYNANWKYVKVVADRNSDNADTEITIEVTKKGGISEVGPTVSTVGDGPGSTAYWETTIRSSWTENVLVKLEGNTSAGAGEEVLSFYIDEVSQLLNVQGIGQYYWIGKITGDRELKVVCTRTTGTDANASIFTGIYAMPNTGTPNYFNYGTLLFSETNTD